MVQSLDQNTGVNVYEEEGETTTWPEEKGQKDKQRYTKYYTENKRSTNTKERQK